MSGSAKKVILLVEDEKVTAKAVTKILEKHNYIVHHALSGADAISIVNNSEKIDLLLTDIDLGGGIDGTIAAREILKYRNIPVLFLSSHTEPEIVEKQEEKLVIETEAKSGKIWQVDMAGKDARTGGKARLVAAVVPVQGRTWFYKLMGKEEVVEREKSAFTKFVQSAEY